MANSFQIALTPDQYASVKAKATEHGINPKPIWQSLPVTDGVALNYEASMDGANYVLNFVVAKKPFYVSVDEIESHVKALISG